MAISVGNILEQLVAMSRHLGDPGKGYAILAEGNTSARIDDDTFYVKASGTTLAAAGPSGFLVVSSSRIMELLDDPAAGDAEVTRVLHEALVDERETRRPSVEVLLHAILLNVPEYAFVGHTHPVYTNMLLCSKVAEEAASGRIFPDHIVSMGHKSVFVPYVDPGLHLAREVKSRFELFVEEEGVLPRAILIQNHGFIAVGDSPKAVTSCTDMAEKASRILVGAYAAAGPHFMEPKDVERIFTRSDEAYRLRYIAG